MTKLGKISQSNLTDQLWCTAIPRLLFCIFCVFQCRNSHKREYAITEENVRWNNTENEFINQYPFKVFVKCHLFKMEKTHIFRKMNDENVDILTNLKTSLIFYQDRFPVINNLIQKINLRKRRDTIILASVIATCTILLMLYAFHWREYCDIVVRVWSKWGECG